MIKIEYRQNQMPIKMSLYDSILDPTNDFKSFSIEQCILCAFIAHARSHIRFIIQPLN